MQHVEGRGWYEGRQATWLLGVLLVVGGVVLLVAQYARIDLGHYGWPLFVIVPGLALLATRLLPGRPAGPPPEPPPPT